MRNRHRRQREQRSFKGRNAVIFIIILTFLVMVTHLKIYEFKTRLALADYYEVKDSTQTTTINSLLDENEVLKEKLERSSKVITSDTTKELVRFYIRKYFPQSEWQNAEKITKCESGMSPDSIGNNKNGSVDRGVWQINTVHAKRFKEMYGIDWTVGAHDIDLSTQYAKFLYNHSSWGPWTCRKVL